MSSQPTCYLYNEQHIVNHVVILWYIVNLLKRKEARSEWLAREPAEQLLLSSAVCQNSSISASARVPN